jgi:hypothetical protein
MLALIMVAVHPSFGQTLQPPFDDDYTVHNLGSVPGLEMETPYGGLVFDENDPNVLLIGGSANQSDGKIFAITVVRDGASHVTGFSGTATQLATAPNIDGGLAYGPDGILFYTAYPIHELGQIKSGSAAPDKIVSLSGLGISGSVGALNFVPAGSPGAGQLKIVSYNAATWYTATLSSDGSGTFDVPFATFHTTLSGGGGPEGFIYIPAGSPEFAVPSILVSEFSGRRLSLLHVRRRRPCRRRARLCRPCRVRERHRGGRRRVRRRQYAPRRLLRRVVSVRGQRQLVPRRRRPLHRRRLRRRRRVRRRADGLQGSREVHAPPQASSQRRNQEQARLEMDQRLRDVAQ